MKKGEWSLDDQIVSQVLEYDVNMIVVSTMTHGPIYYLISLSKDPKILKKI